MLAIFKAETPVLKIGISIYVTSLKIPNKSNVIGHSTRLVG